MVKPIRWPIGHWAGGRATVDIRDGWAATRARADRGITTSPTSGKVPSNQHRKICSAQPMAVSRWPDLRRRQFGLMPCQHRHHLIAKSAPGDFDTVAVVLTQFCWPDSAFPSRDTTGRRSRRPAAC